MFPLRPRVSRLFLIILVSCAWLYPSAQAYARQTTGAWGDDGCYYEGQAGQWVMTGCLQVDVNGAKVFVSVELSGSDGYSYYYVHDYGTGVTTWYALVVDDNGTTQWVPYADLVSTQLGGGNDACGVMGEVSPDARMAPAVGGRIPVA